MEEVCFNFVIVLENLHQKVLEFILLLSCAPFFLPDLRHYMWSQLVVHKGRANIFVYRVVKCWMDGSLLVSLQYLGILLHRSQGGLESECAALATKFARLFSFYRGCMIFIKENLMIKTRFGFKQHETSFDGRSCCWLMGLTGLREVVGRRSLPSLRLG